MPLETAQRRRDVDQVRLGTAPLGGRAVRIGVGIGIGLGLGLGLCRFFFLFRRGIFVALVGGRIVLARGAAILFLFFCLIATQGARGGALATDGIPIVVFSVDEPGAIPSALLNQKRATYVMP